MTEQEQPPPATPSPPPRPALRPVHVLLIGLAALLGVGEFGVGVFITAFAATGAELVVPGWSGPVVALLGLAAVVTGVRAVLSDRDPWLAPALALVGVALLLVVLATAEG